MLCDLVMLIIYMYIDCNLSSIVTSRHLLRDALFLYARKNTTRTLARMETLVGVY